MSDQKNRIAFFSPKYMGGSETWIWRQVKYLKPFISFIGVQQKCEKSDHNGTPLFNIFEDQSLLRRTFSRFFGMRKDIDIIRYNLRRAEKTTSFKIFYIHYLTQAYQFREILLRTKKSIFIHCHGYDVTWDLRKLQFPFINLYGDEYLEFAKGIQEKAVFIANSDFTKKNIMSIGIKSNRIKVLKFGVNTKNKIPKRKKDIINILFLGRLVDFKGPHLTIMAFEKACEMGLNAKLVIAGDGPLMTTCRILRNRSKFRNRITILGEVTFEKGEELRKNSDIFTAHNMKGELSNQIESYGVSILEAMAWGLPVVTGRSGGVNETVVNGKSGYLFTPGNIEEQGLRLFELGKNEDLRKKMGDYARDHVREKFSIEKEERELLKIINDRKS